MLSKMVEVFSEQYTTIEEATKKIKSLQSQKCRLKKQQSRPDYDKLMQKVTLEEEAMKQVIQAINGPRLTITTMTEEQLRNLSYDETVKAIKSIQSKKCLTQYDTDQTEYNKACSIEAILVDHRTSLKPMVNSVSYRKIDELLEYLENNPKTTKADIIRMIAELKN